MKIKRILSLCSTTTTATLLVSTFWVFLNTVLNGRDILTEKMDFLILPQILLVGILTGAGSVLILEKDEMSVREAIIRQVIHLIYICAVVLGLGAWFDWYTVSIMGVVLMLFSVAAVYVLTYYIDYHQSKKLAERLNEKLNEANRDK